jgi:hypothetical protein
VRLWRITHKKDALLPGKGRMIWGRMMEIGSQ